MMDVGTELGVDKGKFRMGGRAMPLKEVKRHLPVNYRMAGKTCRSSRDRRCNWRDCILYCAWSKWLCGLYRGQESRKWWSAKDHFKSRRPIVRSRKPGVHRIKKSTIRLAYGSAIYCVCESASIGCRCIIEPLLHTLSSASDILEKVKRARSALDKRHSAW